MQNKYTMMDCIDLINNEIGYENCGKAIKYVDDNFGNEWLNHINEVEKMVLDMRYTIDKNFVIETSTFHFGKLKEFIARYKNSLDVSRDQFDLFFKA